MQTRIGPWQLAMVSLGSVIGAGWLFSPFYGLQIAGGAILLAWLVAAALSLVISLSFSRMCMAFPLVGGTYRLLGITHPRSTSQVFLMLGWVSYVVVLPLEAQSVVQYLSFWWPPLVRHLPAGDVELSWGGLALGAALVLALSWFNTLHITRVTRANAILSVWKILIPLVVAGVVIVGFGTWEHFGRYWNRGLFDVEPALQAVIGSGLVFSFTGFQNGLILANQAADPRRAVPFSVYMPLALGLVIYMSLSASYMASMPGDGSALASAAAPLLGLLTALGLTLLTPVLLLDAIASPLGTANVYVAVTSRLLYACGFELRPDSRLTRLNRHGSPVLALWINAVVGLLFLLPFPTWKQLVSLLSSMTVFTFLAGPVSLAVLGSRIGEGKGLRAARSLAVAGFLCCTWMVYWGGLRNLGWLCLAVALAVTGYGWLHGRVAGLRQSVAENGYLVVFVAALWGLAWSRQAQWLAFPWDNVLVAVVGCAACWMFVRSRLDATQLQQQIDRISAERRDDAMAAVAAQ